MKKTLSILLSFLMIISCVSVTSFMVFADEKDIESIEFILASPIVLYENQGGYYVIDVNGEEYDLHEDEKGYYYGIWNEDTNDYIKTYVDINDENVFFFYSRIPFSKNGNKLIVHYKDGTSETLTQHFFFDSNNRGFKLVDENGEIVDDESFRYNWEITKDKPFALGSNNYITVKYLNHTTKVPVTVTENNVDKIEFITSKPIEFNVDDKNDFYFYEYEDGYEYSFSATKNLFTDGNKLKVYFNDGTTKTYSFYNEYEYIGSDEYNPVIGFKYWVVDENGSELNYDLFGYEGTDIKFYGYGNDVDEIQWSSGNIYHVKFTYLGAETIVPITLTSDSISHTHSYTTQIIAPTCTTQGYTIYTCTCSDTHNDNYVNAKGHTPKAAVKENVKAATYTATGSYDSVVYCSVCGSKISRTKVTIPKLAKKANTLTVKAKSPTVKFNKLKKKNQTIEVGSAMTVSKAQGTVTYTLISANKGKKNFKKYFSVDKKTGKITVKKKLAKGTYKVAIKVNAAGNTYYKAGAKTVTVNIKVQS